MPKSDTHSYLLRCHGWSLCQFAAGQRVQARINHFAGILRFIYFDVHGKRCQPLIWLQCWAARMRKSKKKNMKKEFKKMFLMAVWHGRLLHVHAHSHLPTHTYICVCASCRPAYSPALMEQSSLTTPSNWLERRACSSWHVAIFIWFFFFKWFCCSTAYTTTPFNVEWLK